jgi:hypothetical protein
VAEEKRYPLIKGAVPQFSVEMGIIGVVALGYVFFPPDQGTRSSAVELAILTIGPIVSIVKLFVKLRQEKLTKGAGEPPPAP